MKAATTLRITYVGGPTAIIELGKLRLLTDPTFDPAGSVYRMPAYALSKLQPPAIGIEGIGDISAVLLSHDHHFDNLDNAGRLLLGKAGRVLTTPAAAARLGTGAKGLAHWESILLGTPDDEAILITATPGRHGPADGDRGPVIGFVISLGAEGSGVYVSGDTVWYEGIKQVAERFRIGLALLFMGAARVQAASPHHLTFTAAEGVEAARALDHSTIVPLHYEGWAHFTEHRPEIQQAFDQAGLGHRLCWLPPGAPVEFSWPQGQRRG